ncbi:MAG: glycosyltransferase family 2 protein [Deltaproteobacteria bacterium]|nr:glycosyltransferase family 2 protein [Deltaproteobacteria bacterium]
MESTAVSVIIPAHNEAETIGDLVRSIQTLYPDYEIIVVNDGSGDNTGKAASDAGAIVYSHSYNIGNGAAIKSGIRIASGDIMVFMDGDGQHEPEEIGELLEHLPAFDMVVGARPKGRQSSWRRGLGNRLLNWLATYVSKFKIMDLTSGFRAVKAPIARNFLYLLPNTYSYPTTLTLGVLRSGRSLKYIPVEVQVRKGGKSNIKLFRDGIRFFMIITKICALYSPLRIFLPLSFFMFLTGLGYYLYTYIFWGRFTNMSALLFTTSVLVFLMGLISEQITQMRFERSEGDRFI